MAIMPPFLELLHRATKLTPLCAFVGRVLGDFFAAH
jgi:hypothetical protein